MALLASFLEWAGNEEAHKVKDHVKVTYPPILLLMNINGLLVHRTDKTIVFGDLTEHPGRYVEMIKIKGPNKCYLRDGHMAFLRALMSHPRVQFAFYSSIMRKNIHGILLKMFAKDMSLFQEHMTALFDQTHNKPAPQITGEKWARIRDLT